MPNADNEVGGATSEAKRLIATPGLLCARKDVLVMEHASVKQSRRCCRRPEKEFQVNDGSGKKRILTAEERIACCCRSCGCLCLRAFSLNLKSGKAGAYQMNHRTMCCSWLSCLGCCRHRMSVFDRKRGSRIGDVESDCKCCPCFPSFSLKDEHGNLLYRVSKDVGCCACVCNTLCGACVKKCCSSCGCRMHMPRGFSITGHGDHKGDTGSVIRLFDRREEDTYRVAFPGGADEYARTLMVGAAMLIDYTMYNQGSAPEEKAVAAPAKESMK